MAQYYTAMANHAVVLLLLYDGNN